MVNRDQRLSSGRPLTLGEDPHQRTIFTLTTNDSVCKLNIHHSKLGNGQIVSTRQSQIKAETRAVSIKTAVSQMLGSGKIKLFARYFLWFKFGWQQDVNIKASGDITPNDKMRPKTEREKSILPLPYFCEDRTRGIKITSSGDSFLLVERCKEVTTNCLTASTQAQDTSLVRAELWLRWTRSFLHGRTSTPRIEPY